MQFFLSKKFAKIANDAQKVTCNEIYYLKKDRSVLMGHADIFNGSVVSHSDFLLSF